MSFEWIAEAFAETRDSLEACLDALTPEDFLRETPCPGWRVRDIVAHLVGLDREFRGEPAPDVDVTTVAHVKNERGARNERDVVALRNVDVATLLTMFHNESVRAATTLRALSDEEWVATAPLVSSLTPTHRVAETRVFDSWVHLQDIRDATLQPQDDHGVAEEMVLNRYEASMPYVFGKIVQPPEGTTARLVITGHFARTVNLRIIEGRAQALETTPGDVDVEIVTPAALFWRRCAGRIGASAFLLSSATSIRGSLALAQHWAEAMAVTP